MTTEETVPVPVDRPRRPGVPARCSAVTTVPRAEFGVAPDDVVLAGFAATLFRYTGGSPITVDDGTKVMRYTVTGDTTLDELVAAGEPTSASLPSTELRLAVHPDRVELRYDDRLFDESTAARMLGHVRTLVKDAGRTPERPVRLLRLLPDDETYRMLVTWNRTDTDLPYDRCIHQAFEAHAARTPDAVAVVHRGERWTYARVNAEANRLARHLRSLGVGPDVGVGLCLDRSPGLLIAMLGAMKAGGAYVPLDPGYPTGRLATMVRGNTFAVLISRTGLTANLPDVDRPVVLLDRDADMLSALPGHDLDAFAGPDDLCYIIHTSGSTGKPKPIALCHRGVLNNLIDLSSHAGAGPGDSVLSVSSPSFDMSVYEYLGMTAAGGTVVIPDQDRGTDPAHWAELLVAERVTVWNSAPPLLGLLVDHLEQHGAAAPLALRVAMLGGDWAPVTLPDRARAVVSGLRVVVFGGNTEASILSTAFEVSTVDPAWRSIPYGRPMANQRTYILDGDRQPVPPGVPGELCLAGVGLARGYLNLPEQTAERFIEWSHGPITGERLYRTGDLARFSPDGMIELLGRMDFQVKINGHRVELGEIEAVLRGHDGVRETAVVARDGRLIAYVVPDGPAPATDDLHDLAARKLPGYMIPAVFVYLDTLPLTPNGKLDRNGLPEPQVADVPYRAPRTAAEHVLAGIYADVLGVARIGVDDDFISMGGDSIRAIQVMSRARARGIELTAPRILQLGTIAAIAPTARAVVAIEDTAAPLAVVSEDEMAELAERYPGLTEVWPLTSMQSGMLFESLLAESGSGSYLLQTVYHLSGTDDTVDAARMRAVGRALLDRHAGLRAAFVCDAADSPVQVVVADLEPAWREVDLAGLAGDAQEAAFQRFLVQDQAQPFDLATPPLVRLALVRFGPQRSRLVVTAHHLLIDGWSEQVLADDMVRLYAGAELAPARSYGEFLAWLSQQDGAAHTSAWRAELDGCHGPTTLVAPDAHRGQADVHELVVSLTPGELAPETASGITAGTVVHCAWACMLAGLTGREDVVFGTTASGRPGELVGVESMVGLFINTVPVRCLVHPKRTVDDLLTGLRTRQAALLAHQHHGLSEIHQDLGVSALFDTLVVFQSFPAARADGTSLAVTRVESVGSGSYPLTLIVEAERLTVQYDRNLFDAATVEDIAARFRSVARQLAAGGDRTIGTLADLPTGPLGAAESAAGVDPDDGGAALTPRQEALSALFAEVLGVERVGVDDNIFALGCNSLKATRIIGRMRRTLGLEASIRTIFEYPTVAELADRVTAAQARPSLRRTNQ